MMHLKLVDQNGKEEIKNVESTIKLFNLLAVVGEGVLIELSKKRADGKGFMYKIIRKNGVFNLIGIKRKGPH